MAFDVFVSHSSKDKLTADAVCAVLENRGIRCWIAPRDIQPGADWGESILEGIRACRVMVLVFSRNANESVQIKREVERAVHNGKPIIPLRIEDILPTGTLEFSISTAHWLDAFSPPMERHLNYLADTVAAILEGKPQPKRPPLLPPPPPWYKTRNGQIACGVAALTVLCLLVHFLFPPSLKGDWVSNQPITAPVNSAFADIITAALTSSTVEAKLEVKSLNQYSLSVTATDSGTVAQAQASDSVKQLTFTSNTTHKSTTTSYYFSDTINPGAFGAFGVPANSKMLMWGINMGAGTVVTYTSADSPGGGDTGSSGLDPAIVGTWTGSPFNVNPPNGFWSGSLVIHADGTYTLTVTHQESGILTVANGTWSAKPAAGGMYGMGAPSLFNDAGSSATYSLSGSTLQIATTNGSLTFQRGW